MRSDAASNRHVDARRSVLILAYAWPPSPWIGAVRPVYLARQLALQGWRPVVITVREEYDITLREVHDKKSVGGIAGADSALVIRTRCWRSPAQALARLKRVTALRSGEKRAAADYGRASLEAEAKPSAPRLRENLVSVLNAPDECVGWFPFALRAASRAVRRHRPRCVISTGPPHTAHLVAMALKGLHGIDWIADFRDPWAWHDHTRTHSLWSDRVNATLERLAIRRASRVVCVSPGVSSEYAKRYPAEPPEKWVTITNGFDLEEFRSLGTVERAERFTISYAGSLAYGRSPMVVLQALAELISERAIDSERVSLRFLGHCEFVEGRPLASIVEALGLGGVAEVVPLIPRSQALRELLRSHVLLLIAATQRHSISAKLFEYLAAGRPILAVAVQGASSEIVDRLGAGRVVAPDDVPAAKEAIRRWYAEFLATGDCRAYNEAGQAAAALEYDWSRLGLRYSHLIDSCGEMA
jgi:glycosyltransferase involved in cell wall biosynthesis